MTIAFLFRAAIGCALIAIAGCAPSSTQTSDAPPVARLRLVPLDISTANATLHFRVELASSDPEQERGLMYRTSLPKKGGMIFPMTPPREATFWMKNTLIPLDLIFIRADGHIARIAANATPESLDIIDSGEPVAAVLEIAGGGAAAAGIKVDDVVRWSN